MSGVVYQLKVTLSDQDSIFYIGSTTDLPNRMRLHVRGYNNCTSCILYETGCPVTCTVLEDVEFGLDTDLLRIREQHWLNLCRGQSENCVNKRDAYTTPLQKKKKKQARYKANPEMKIKSRLRYQNDKVAAARQRENQRIKRVRLRRIRKKLNRMASFV